VSEVVIVVGHEAQRIKDRIGGRFEGLTIHYVEAPEYRTTNNITSLWEARNFCDQDLILLDGDVVFDPEVLTDLHRVEGSSIAVAPYQPVFSGTVVRRNEQEVVTSIDLTENQAIGYDFSDTFKTVNISLLRKSLLRDHFVPELERRVSHGFVHDFYERILRDLVAAGALVDLHAIDVSAARWYEVDDQRDLEIAEFTFLERGEQFDRLQTLHGSFWRYGFGDHVHPIFNPAFPPTEMLDGLRRDLVEIIQSYPVGQAELARLAGRWLGTDPAQLVVANGASELIKLLGAHFVDQMTIHVPAFNEYENSVPEDRLTRFPLTGPDFRLDTERFAAAVRESGSNVAVIISPNIPTAQSVPHDQILDLARNVDRDGCRLIVDESFVEYSRRGRAASVTPYLASYPNIAVIKSVGKVCGIAGIRLGYLCSADLEFTDKVRARLPIWNANGLAEAFLRRAGRYQIALDESFRLVRETYQNLYEQLCQVPGLEPLEPDANFVLCRISVPGILAAEVARKLYIDHNILIKDCTQNTMPEAARYLRIGSRTTSDNSRLVLALGRVMHDFS
jgi:histidinol-phosphate/aromatic aminotransferase/cobyric acid decarboxylase-like protein/choline kinase